MNYFQRKFNDKPSVVFTDVQMEQLAQFEGAGKPFTTALNAQYVRAIPARDMDLMLAIYKEATGKDYPINRSCAGCVIGFVRTMGNAFRETLKRQADANE